jgi:uncharacterized protein (DUF1684 family)
MKFSKLLVLASFAALAGLIYYSFKGGISEEGFKEEITKEREEKTSFLKKGKDSPFATLAEEFKGLQYFEPDLSHRVKATLKPIQDKKVIILGTSDGKEQKYLEYAYALFTLNHVDCQLLILEVMDMGPLRGKLFLAFADETSGKETYGGGRYLDIKKVPAATSIVLDFNKAYNPYCAYNDSYSCPFPPSENVLKVSIRAGEMIYHNQ